MVISIQQNYSKMCLSEACHAAVLEVNELVNDLKIQTILDEYTYLLDEGTELVYVPPKEIPKSKQDSTIKKITDRIISALKVFKEKVFNLLDKAIIALREKINSSKIMPLYLKYKNNYEIFKNLHNHDIEEFFRDNTSVCIDTAGKDIYSIFENDHFYMDNPMEINNNKIYTSDDVYNYYVKPSDQWTVNGASDLYEDGIREGFANRWSMSFIKDYKKQIDINVKNNIKDLENENPTELLNKYSIMMKNNINVVHGYVRIWSKYVGECARIVVAMASNVKEKTIK